MSALVRDVDEAQFGEVVVEGSKTRPVVVDFWAEWCGPCRQLSPLLEQMAERYAGEVDVVKVDVDANPRIAQAFRIQGIPAVKAFAGGKLASEFVGLQPSTIIESFFEKLRPSEADRLVAKAATASDALEREELYRKALEAQADHPGAAVGLAGVLEDPAAALEVLNRALPTQEVQQAIASLRLRQVGAAEGDLTDLRGRVEQGDPVARVTLGRALAAAGQHGDAIEILLEGVRHPDTREPAREALLEIFTILGNDDPLVKATRPRLASALF